MQKLLKVFCSLTLLSMAVPSFAGGVTPIVAYNFAASGAFGVPALSPALLAGLALVLAILAVRIMKMNGVRGTSLLVGALAVGTSALMLNSAQTDAIPAVTPIVADTNCNTGGTTITYDPLSIEAEVAGSYLRNDCPNAITIDIIFTQGSCVLVQDPTPHESPELPGCSDGMVLGAGESCDYLICQPPT